MIVCVRAPVPHPTSSQWAEGFGRSHSTNARASGRLQRPMYASDASPANHLSSDAFIVSFHEPASRSTRPVVDASKCRQVALTLVKLPATTAPNPADQVLGRQLSQLWSRAVDGAFCSYRGSRQPQHGVRPPSGLSTSLTKPTVGPDPRCQGSQDSRSSPRVLSGHCLRRADPQNGTITLQVTAKDSTRSPRNSVSGRDDHAALHPRGASQPWP